MQKSKNTMKNIFEQAVKEEMEQRVNALTPESKANWGKMNVAQMLAHCNVPYEMALTEKYPKAKGIKRWLLSKTVKNIVCSEKPYKKNSRTAPEFVIVDEREFEMEKNTILENIQKVYAMGEAQFDGKESTSFGPLNSKEWSNLFYKHLNHHLEQFGA